MKIKPIGARVLIQEIKPEETTKSGILLPASKEKTQMALVLEVGQDTDKEKITVAKGDKVIFSQYAGTPIQSDDGEVRIVAIEDILAVITD